jgi:TolB protein
MPVADPGSQTQLTSNTAVDESPVWSPDGAKIAFVSARTGDSEIFVMDADGGNPLNISNDVVEDNTPDW